MQHKIIEVVGASYSSCSCCQGARKLILLGSQRDKEVHLKGGSSCRHGSPFMNHCLASVSQDGSSATIHSPLALLLQSSSFVTSLSPAAQCTIIPGTPGTAFKWLAWPGNGLSFLLVHSCEHSCHSVNEHAQLGDRTFKMNSRPVSGSSPWPPNSGHAR